LNDVNLTESDHFFTKNFLARKERRSSSKARNLSFHLHYQEQVNMCKKNLMLNSILSLALLAISLLPYFLPWSDETSTVISNKDEKKLQYGLFNVWVPLS